MAQRQGGSSGMGSPLGVEGAAAAVDKAFDAKAAGGSRLLALALVVVVVLVLVLVLPILMLVLSLVLVVVLVGMLVLMAMLVVTGSAVVMLVPVGAMAVLVAVPVPVLVLPVLVLSVAVALVVVAVAVPLAAAGAARLCLTGLAALVPMLVCLLAFRVLRLLQRPGSCHSAPAAAQQAGSGRWLSRVQARHRAGTGQAPGSCGSPCPAFLSQPSK